MLILPSQPRVSFSTQPSQLLLLGQWLSRVCQATPPLLLSSGLVFRLLTLQWPGTRQMGLIPSQLSQPPRRSQLRFPRMGEGPVLLCGCLPLLLCQWLLSPRRQIPSGFQLWHNPGFTGLVTLPSLFNRRSIILPRLLLEPQWDTEPLLLLGSLRGRLAPLRGLTNHPLSCIPGAP